MSHIVTTKTVITDLDAMERACANIGLEFMRDQTSFKWYESTPQKCDHAIRLPNNDRAYEIGLVARKGEDEEGFEYQFDFYAGGYGIEEVAGKDCTALTTEYVSCLAETMMPDWFQERTQLEDGTVVLELTQ